ncbi:hypothetical protein MGSAQ_001014 [marine sediment metagenome]|uniref:Uncharacterized protein n=1 Tax=marine sediment metagenome TaxID=412755 RepID=A0A1B6NVJ7_9ZZZZ
MTLDSSVDFSSKMFLFNINDNGAVVDKHYARLLL